MIFCGRYAGSSRSLGVRDDPFDLVSDLLNGSVIFLVVGGEGQFHGFSPQGDHASGDRQGWWVRVCEPF